MEAAECGAAALGSILAYHGLHVPLERLRLDCGVSRDGSKAINIVKAARTHGMIASGYRKEPAGLRTLPLPMIVFWELAHFVVVEGFGKGKVYLNDPATGPRTVSDAELDASFAGIALTFEPGPNFRKGGERPSLTHSLRTRLAGSSVALAFCVIAGLALVLPGLVVPAFTRIFVDDVLVRSLDSWLRPLLLAMVLTALVRGALTWLQQHYLLRLETRLALTTSSRFFWHVLRLPVEFFSQRFGGEIGSRVAINDRVAQLLSGELATNVLNLVTIVFFAAVMLRYDVTLTVIGLLICALNFGILTLVSRRRRDTNRVLLEEQGKLLGTGMWGLRSIETLKASGSESDFFARWSGYQVKALNVQQELGLYNLVLSVTPPLLSALNTVAILAVGGLRVMDGRMSVGMLAAFQTLMASLVEPVNRLVNLGSTLQEAEGAMSRLDDVLSSRTDAGLLPGPPPAEGAAARLSGHLEIRNVSFGYSLLEPPLLAGFDLHLRPGARVAVVGPTGSGKSTVARLVAGLYEPWEGEVRLDGVARRELPRRLVAASVAMVDQEVFLFEGTVRENLTLWDPTVSEEEIVQAAKDAAVHEVIAARRGGYESPVEEGGRNFSGGERQRLEIARALLARPSLLILDEATSALDPSTEERIDDNLRRRGCTCLIVAHRLSTIRDCDEIVVLDRGTILQRGTHEELMRAEGPYAGLVRAT